MAKISLIGVDLAKEGLEFTFVTPLVGCAECRIKNVCFNLEPGRKYRITKVRDKINPCFVFNGDKVSTIEVEEVQNYAHIQHGKKLQEGSTITLSSINCDNYACPNIETCNLIHMRDGTKAIVEKIDGKVDCPKGYDLRKVAINLH